ncbi:MAG: hypothetical protein LBT46_15005 [Planctomycetaceae bacterium]|jgi:hypothetical protein|nr:hypothetical protein [Planctomycetaceae bacterium]
MNVEVEKILNEIEIIRDVYQKLFRFLPSFSVTDKSVLPYGLKPHTRSVSWLVEQVITQQTKYRKDEMGLDNVDFDMPDTCLHDCEIIKNGTPYYINIKVHNIGGKENKNDIAAVEKLYMQYSANPDYDLIYACFGIRFQDIVIHFDPSYIQLFSPQFMPIYVNPRNDKIQAFYNHQPEYRTRQKFLQLLRDKSTSIKLPK